VILGCLVWRWVAAGTASVPFRRFAVRHGGVHALFAVCLLGAVRAFKSGRYVAAHYNLSDGIAEKLGGSWRYMTLYSDIVPYLMVGGALTVGVVVWSLARHRALLRERQVAVGWWLLLLGLCFGFWLVNVPWGQSIEKYYLPANVFGCAAGVALLSLSCSLLLRSGLRAAAGLWLVGSLVFLLRHAAAGERASRLYYLQQYGHRDTIPKVVEDVATEARRASPTCRVQIVTDELYQEGALPILRWVNRYRKLNIATDGTVVSTVPAIERNYFRRYADRPAVEVEHSQKLPEPFVADIFYFLVLPTPDWQRRLATAGFRLEAEWVAGKSGCRIWKYTRR
jgi:hypothetical protein